MSEYKLNLSDKEAESLTEVLNRFGRYSLLLTGEQLLVADAAAEQLKKQTPLPTRHGAVVQTDFATYVLAEVHSPFTGGAPDLPWLELTHTGGAEWVEAPEGEIQKILFEGL